MLTHSNSPIRVCAAVTLAGSHSSSGRSASTLGNGNMDLGASGYRLATPLHTTFVKGGNLSPWAPPTWSFPLPNQSSEPSYHPALPPGHCRIRSFFRCSRSCLPYAKLRLSSVAPEAVASRSNARLLNSFTYPPNWDRLTSRNVSIQVLSWHNCLQLPQICRRLIIPKH